jgi:acyl-CoA dehydrogenase
MIQVGPRNFLANLHFANPISITVEGANILTRNLIIFGQGAIRCHPYLLKEVELIAAPNVDVKALDQVLMSHIGFYTKNFLKNIAYGLTGGKLIRTTIKNSKIRKYQRQLTRMSAALALMADTSLILLGGSLKRRERISARLGDIMGQLYLASTILKYYADHQQPASDVSYVCWGLQHCLFKIQIALDELFANFPKRWVGKLMNWIIFPFGRAYFAPRDRLHNKLVKPMVEPSELRDRLTKYCYISTREDELGCRLDTALTQVSSIEPIWKKMNKAAKTGTALLRQRDYAARAQAAFQAGVISSDEATLVSNFEALRSEIMKVNEFSFDLNRVIA